LTVPSYLSRAARSPARVRLAFGASRAHGRRRLRGPAVRRTFGGAAARRGATRPHARPPTRRHLHRRAADDSVSPTRKAEPAAWGLPRARSGATALARLVSARRRWHGDPLRPLPASLLTPHAAAVPRVVRRNASHGPRQRCAGRGRGSCRRRSSRARGLPRRTLRPSAAALRGLGRLPAGARPPRPRDHRRVSRSRRSPTARLRAHTRRRAGPDHRARVDRTPAAGRHPAVAAVLPAARRLRLEDLREELLRALMRGCDEEVFGGSLLDDAALVHHPDAV